MRPLLRPAASFVIFCVVLLSLAWVLHTRPADANPPGRATELMNEVAAGESLDFVVAGTEDRVRIITRLAMALSAPPDDRQWPWQVDVQWIDHAGEVVHEATVHERAGVSHATGARARRWRHARMPGDERWLTDERISLVPVASVLPGGGHLRVSLAGTADAALVRAFALVATDPIALERALIAPSRKQVALALKHSGVSSWSALEQGERRALLAMSWQRLDALHASGPDSRARPVIVELPRQTIVQRRARSLVLEPGRRLAVNLQGPVKVRLSGAQDVSALVATLVSDHPPDASPASLREISTTTVGFIDESIARGLVLRDPWPTSLHIENPTGAPIAFRLSMDNPREDQVFGATGTVALADLLPRDALARRQTALLAPPRRLLSAWPVGPDTVLSFETPGFGPSDPVRLTVRAVLDGPGDTRPRQIEVVAYDLGGAEVWRGAEDVDAQASHFERVDPAGALDANTWLAEPVRLYTALPRGTAVVAVTSVDTLLVSAATQGPVEGGSAQDNLPYGAVNVRYGDVATAWRPLPPVGEASPLQVHANTRFEHRGDPDAAYTAESYTALRPHSGDAGHLWLHPPSTSATSPTVFCRVDAGSASGLMAPGAPPGGHALLAWLWSPRAGLGQTWSILADGMPWRAGRLSQRLTRVRAVRQSAIQRVSLDAPSGAFAFLRLDRAVSRCDQPWVGRNYHPVGPGRTLVYRVDKDRGEQSLVVGALGRDSGWLDVGFGGGSGTLGLVQTRRSRAVKMVSTDDAAIQARSPDHRLSILKSRAVMMHDDLANGRHEVRVTNLSDHTLWLRLAVEAEGPSSSGQRGAGWYRAEETGP